MMRFSQLADYYYEERICVLRCVLHLLTYFQDERHPYMVGIMRLSCVCYHSGLDRLEESKEMIGRYRFAYKEILIN